MPLDEKMTNFLLKEMHENMAFIQLLEAAEGCFHASFTHISAAYFKDIINFRPVSYCDKG